MTLLHIEEWQNRYHPGSFQEVALEQFEKVRTVVLDQALENAVQSLNLNDRELICIREIQVPVYLRLSGTLQSQAACWSNAIVKQIQQQRHSKNGQSVVRYLSRGHAWISCAMAVLKGQFCDSWAWKQIGVIDTDITDSLDVALSKLLTALANEPGYLLPVINALRAEKLFETLLLSSCDAHWRKIQEILEHSFNTRIRDIFSAQDHSDCSFEAISILPGISQSKETKSRLQIPDSLVPIRHFNLQSRQTIILLVLALNDPGILYRSPDIVSQKLNTLLKVNDWKSLHEVDVQIISTPESVQSSLDTAHEQQELPGKKLTTPDLDQNIKRKRLIKNDDSLDENNFDVNNQCRNEKQSTGFIQTSENAEDQINQAQTVTSYGGLLYLLNLLEQPCGLVDILTQDSCFSQRSMVWVWLHLVVSIIPAELDDPAVLAFAGLLQGKKLEEELLLRPDDAEQLQLDHYAAEINSAAKDRLEHAGSDLSMHMGRLYRRRALITSYPGWYEVEFSLNDVDTGIRRAGLDIDPGFLPWLSVVMRFKYA